MMKSDYQVLQDQRISWVEGKVWLYGQGIRKGLASRDIITYGVAMQALIIAPIVALTFTIYVYYKFVK